MINVWVNEYANYLNLLTKLYVPKHHYISHKYEYPIYCQLKNKIKNLLRQRSDKGNFLYLIKSVDKELQQTSSFIMKANSFLLRSGARQECSFTYTQQCVWGSGQCYEVNKQISKTKPPNFPLPKSAPQISLEILNIIFKMLSIIFWILSVSSGSIVLFVVILSHSCFWVFFKCVLSPRPSFHAYEWSICKCSIAVTEFCVLQHFQVFTWEDRLEGLGKLDGEFPDVRSWCRLFLLWLWTLA